MDNRLDISWKTLWRIFFVVALATVLFLTREVVLIFLFAIVISSALDGPVDFLEKRKIPRVLATILIFAFLLTIFAMVVYTIVPISINEAQNFLQTINSKTIPLFGQIDASPLIDSLNSNLGALANNLFSGGVSFVNVITDIFGNIALVLITLILSFYLSIDRAGVEKFLRAIIPTDKEDYVIGIYLRIRKKMEFWLKGQILMMIAVGLLSFIGLWILGIKYSLILGIIAGLFEIIPIAGPIFSGALAFLAAVPVSWELGIYVIILFFIIQQIENHILYPLVMKKTVGISPIIVVLFLLAGSTLAGLPGIILSVPAAIAFQEILSDWEKRKGKFSAPEENPQG